MARAITFETAGKVERSLDFLQGIFGEFHPRNFAVRFWDGTSWNPEQGQPALFTLVLQHPGSLRRMFWPPTEVAMGEAYIFNDIDVEGDLESAFALSDYLHGRPWGIKDLLYRAGGLLRLPSGENLHDDGRQAARLSGTRHSIKRDRQAVTYHYNVSNDFYSLWLDSRMVYSTAYFATPEEDLDTAQARKLDYICRKLRLRPGETFLDIGCGWGGLIRHAAQQYGVDALGITLSEPQAELAAARIRREGLAGRCRVEILDYRELKDTAVYDKVASIGMFEHVGESRLREYFSRVKDLLRPGGVFLNHGIGYTREVPKGHQSSFVDRYVFPDGELLPVSAVLATAERAGFEVRDVESLREHYALTLRHWVRRLVEHREDAVRATNEATYRTWRLYMSGSAHGFATGRLNIYQALLSKPVNGKSGLPLTRADWYC